jgi:hypothetical protein
VDLFNLLAALWKLIRFEYILNGEKALERKPLVVAPVVEQQPKEEATELTVIAESTNGTSETKPAENEEKNSNEKTADKRSKKKGKPKEKREVALDQKTLFLKVCVYSFIY